MRDYLQEGDLISVSFQGLHSEEQRGLGRRGRPWPCWLAALSVSSQAGAGTGQR